MPMSLKVGKGPVLVVEDDPDISSAIRDTLADEGYEVVEARDGQAALDYLHSNPLPPLILLDWNMAPMNGSRFMTEVAKDASLSAIPVVLLTADTKADEKLCVCSHSPKVSDDVCASWSVRTARRASRKKRRESYTMKRNLDEKSMRSELTKQMESAPTLKFSYLK